MKKIILLLFMVCGMIYGIASVKNVSDILLFQNKLIAVNVILILILSGLIFFLVVQDRRIKKLEDQMKE